MPDPTKTTISPDYGPLFSELSSTQRGVSHGATQDRRIIDEIISKTKKPIDTLKVEQASRDLHSMLSRVKDPFTTDSDTSKILGYLNHILFESVYTRTNARLYYSAEEQSRKLAYKCIESVISRALSNDIQSLATFIKQEEASPVSYPLLPIIKCANEINRLVQVHQKSTHCEVLKAVTERLCSAIAIHIMMCHETDLEKALAPFKASTTL